MLIFVGLGKPNARHLKPKQQSVFMLKPISLLSYEILDSIRILCIFRRFAVWFRVP